jgi:hypothetical protein
MSACACCVGEEKQKVKGLSIQSNHQAAREHKRVLWTRFLTPRTCIEMVDPYEIKSSLARVVVVHNSVMVSPVSPAPSPVDSVVVLRRRLSPLRAAQAPPMRQ